MRHTARLRRPSYYTENPEVGRLFQLRRPDRAIEAYIINKKYGLIKT